MEVPATDQNQLVEYENQLSKVRDFVRGVAQGWTTGFYLWGDGGISKTWTVLDELERSKMAYITTNSRLTGRGLVDLLSTYPSVVHVFEDMETLLKDKLAAGVLRSACWSGDKRVVTWRTAHDTTEFTFTGGIIFIMNCPLDDLPELQALKTRIAHLHLSPSTEQIIAKMRSIAAQGYTHVLRGKSMSLSPVQAYGVCEYVVAKCVTLGCKPCLRMLVNAFHDRLQCDAGESSSDWTDMIDSRMKQKVGK
jgi:hypothetical protein